jgi:hypothetical protein
MISHDFLTAWAYGEFHGSLQEDMDWLGSVWSFRTLSLRCRNVVEVIGLLLTADSRLQYPSLSWSRHSVAMGLEYVVL